MNEIAKFFKIRDKNNNVLLETLLNSGWLLIENIPIQKKIYKNKCTIILHSEHKYLGLPVELECNCGHKRYSHSLSDAARQERYICQRTPCENCDYYFKNRELK